MTQQTRSRHRRRRCRLFVLDARAGVTTGDEMIAQALQRSGKNIILVANKCEGRTTFRKPIPYALGFGEAIAVSAEHDQGIDTNLRRAGAVLR